MALVPATSPEQIADALRLISGRYALAGSHKRFRVAGALITGTFVCGIFAFAAWQSRWNPALIVFAGLALFAAAYDVLKLQRVIEIGPDFVEYRMPLRFLCWRIQSSELRVIDVDLGQKEDVLRLVTKTSGKRRLPIPTSVGARLRA